MSSTEFLNKSLDMPQKPSDVKKFQGFHRRMEKWVRRTSLSTLFGSFVMAGTAVTSLVMGIRTSMFHEERAKAIQEKLDNVSQSQEAIAKNLEDSKSQLDFVHGDVLNGITELLKEIYDTQNLIIKNQKDLVKNQEEMSDNQSVISENQYILQSELINTLKQLRRRLENMHYDLATGSGMIYEEILRLIPTEEHLLFRKDVMDRFHKTFEYLSTIALRQDSLYDNTKPQNWQELRTELSDLKQFLQNLQSTPKIVGQTKVLSTEGGSTWPHLVTDGSVIHYGG